jgi:hypothetical protein
MGEAEEPRRRVAHRLTRDRSIGIGRIAARKEGLFTEEAVAAGDGKWDDDTITPFEIVNARAHLDHFSHWFVAENITFFHRWHEAIHQVQIRPANATGGNLDDSIARILDLWVGDVIHPDIALTVPTERFHTINSSVIGQRELRYDNVTQYLVCESVWMLENHRAAK